MPKAKVFPGLNILYVPCDNQAFDSSVKASQWSVPLEYLNTGLNNNSNNDLSFLI